MSNNTPLDRLLDEARAEINNYHDETLDSPRLLDRLVRIVERLQAQRDKYAASIYDAAKMNMLLADDDEQLHRIAEGKEET